MVISRHNFFTPHIRADQSRTSYHEPRLQDDGGIVMEVLLLLQQKAHKYFDELFAHKTSAYVPVFGGYWFSNLIK